MKEKSQKLHCLIRKEWIEASPEEATPLTPKVIQQVTGYNRLLQAYFIAIANHQEVHTGWYDQEKKEHLFIHHLPSYQELKEACLSRNS